MVWESGKTKADVIKLLFDSELYLAWQPKEFRIELLVVNLQRRAHLAGV